MSEARMAYWVEKAAAHQCRALRRLQAVRGADEARPSSAQTRTEQYRALEDLLAARRAVLRAQAVASGTEHRGALQGHLAQLDALIQAAERQCAETEARRVGVHNPVQSTAPTGPQVGARIPLG